MGTTLDVINEWASDSEEKQHKVKTHTGLVLRLLNQAQLRFADKSEILRGSWSPTITSTGNIDLPSDFIREFPDMIKKDSGSTLNYPLQRIDYWQAVNGTFYETAFYSIYNGKLYVWAAGALTPTVPYVKKPAIVTTLTSTDLEVPTQYHSRIVFYMNIKWEKMEGKIDFATENAMLEKFDQQAGLDGFKSRERTDNIPRTRAVLLG